MSRIKKQATIVFDAAVTEVLVRRRPEKGIRSPFSAIGPLTNIKFARRNMQDDVFDRLARVSKGALKIFRDLKYTRSLELNTATYKPDPDLTRTQKETLSRKFKELKAVGLIRSIRGPLQGRDQRMFKMVRGSYIINPDMLRCTNHDEAEHLWGQCADEEMHDGNFSEENDPDEG